MSLDAVELEAAIRRNDAAAVRELLRPATEPERAACAKALKSLLTAPKFHLPEPVFLAPQEFMDFLSSGYQRKPAGIEEQEREFGERSRGYDAWREIARGLAFGAAQFGLAGGVAAATRLARDFYDTGHNWETPEDDAQLVAIILADRRPDWLADFVDRHLRQSDQSPAGIYAWTLARALVRLGAIPRPDVPEYTTLMPGYLPGRRRDEDGRWQARPPAEALLADPGLLEDEIWRLFTVPDAGLELERTDRMPDGCVDGVLVRSPGWAEGLAQLSAVGQIDRGRLIDAGLDAFTRDFHPNRVGWYAGLLQQLQPSEDEMAARATRYLRLLSTAAKPAVKLGQQAAARLLAAGRVDPGQLLDASVPALQFPQKNIATAQLTLVGRVAKDYPELRPRAAATAAAAFGHQRQDVQEAALALIRKIGVPGEPHLTEIRARAADLSPSLATNASSLGLLGGPASASSANASRASAGPADAEQDRADAQPDTILPAQAEIEARIRVLPPGAAEDLSWALTVATAGEVPGPPRIEPSPGARLPAPVTDPDELIQLLTVLIEDARDALAAERALAGAVRLSSLPRHERARIAAPLLKRAQHVMRSYEPFTGDLITSDIALVTHAWAGEQLPGADTSRENSSWNAHNIAVSGSGRALTMAGIFTARAWEAARLVEAGLGGVLLAEPETERGAVFAPTLLRRVRELARRRETACPHDRDVALLRLTPDAPQELWTELGQLTGRPAAALRDADRTLRLPLTFEPVTGLPSGKEPLRGYRGWHQHLLARMVGEVPKTPENACWQLLTALSDPLFDHKVLYGPSQYELRHYDAAVAAWALICPWQPELAAAHLLRPLSDGLISGHTPAATAIESIRRPGHPLGPVGHLALLTGLSADAADTRIAAAQLWSRACADGRLDPKLAATALVRGVCGEALKAGRIADGLQYASHSPLDAYRIVETVCFATTEFAPHFPTGMHGLFELAARLASRVGAPELPVAIRDLAARKGSTRLAATARQLLQSADGPAAERQLAIEQALAAFLLRTETPPQSCGA
jgi:uncharacterized protein DUF6493